MIVLRLFKFLTYCLIFQVGSIFVSKRKKIRTMTEDKDQAETGAEDLKDTTINEEKSEETVEGVSSGEPPTSEPTCEEKFAELNDRFIRLYAEFDNFRKRTNKERIDLINSASSDVIKDLLSVVDNFERAIQNNENAEDIQTIKEGFQLIYQQLKRVLENKGLQVMNSKGEAFDSELHEAIANVPAPTDEEKGKVIDDVEKGYYLNDKVIRFAKVVVGQ
jgi:molecular chaperone GrpE